MGKALVTTWLALAALPAVTGLPMTGDRAAASPVSTQPLAADEVLVELSASGEAVSPADLAIVTIPFTARAATDEAARRGYEAQAARMRAEARAAGAAGDDVEIQPPVSMGLMADYADAEMDTVLEPESADVPEAEVPEPERSYVVSGGMTIRLRDPARVPDLDRALRAIDDTLTPEILYESSDDGPARRAARAHAITIARADAEAYAAALGLRVVRIVRVSERMGMDLMSLMFSNPVLASLMAQGSHEQGPDIVVRVFVGIDFALAPR
jgi:uncharacterized protein